MSKNWPVTEYRHESDPIRPPAGGQNDPRGALAAAPGVPGRPFEQSLEVAEEAVTTFAQFQAASDDADFRIMCSQVPPLSPTRAKAELLAMRDGAAKSLHATLAESKNIDVQGQPAIEFTLNFSAGGAEMVSYTRYLRCRNLLYQQIVTAPAGTNVEQDIRKFFASLKVETQ